MFDLLRQSGAGLSAIASATVPIATPLVIAQIPGPPPAGIGSWFTYALYTVVIGYFLLKVWEAIETRFKRKPAIEEDLAKKADAAAVAEVKLDLAGLVPAKEFELFAEETRVRNRGLEEQISKVRHDFKEGDGAIQNLGRNQFEIVDDAIKTLGSEMRAGFAEGDRKRSVSTGNLHEHLKRTEVELAGVKADTKSTQHKLDHLEQQVDRMPERIKTLLLDKS